MIVRMLAHSSAPVAALSANLAAGCVGLFAPLATVITALGLDWLHSLLLGAGSVGALLYPRHDALDVTTFRILMNGGAAGLAAAATWSFLLCRRAVRRLGCAQ